MSADTASQSVPPEQPAPTLGEIGLDHFAPYLMNRAMGRWNAEMRAVLRAHGLTTAQMRALAVLSARPGLTVAELAVFTVTEQSTMSRTLDTLEARGLIARGDRPGDGRAREARVTTAGAAAFARFWPQMLDGYERMLDGVATPDREIFIRVLQQILRNIRRHPI